MRKQKLYYQLWYKNMDINKKSLLTLFLNWQVCQNMFIISFSLPFPLFVWDSFKLSLSYFFLSPVHSTVHCSLYTIQWTLCTVHCKVYTIQFKCTLYTVNFTLYTYFPFTHSSLPASSRGDLRGAGEAHSVQSTLYTVHCSLYTVHRTL